MILLSFEGMKIILRGNLDAGPCSVERYQPIHIKFLTNVSSECIFSKSKCNEEGQILHDKGSPTQDVACRCDLTQNYDLISRQTASRYCKPAEGDCSCFKKQCHLIGDYSLFIRKIIKYVTIFITFIWHFH